MRKLLFAATLLVASSAAADAFAWGDEGHKVVCEIAISRVKPATRAAITELIRADGVRQFHGRLHPARSSTQARIGALRKSCEGCEQPDR